MRWIGWTTAPDWWTVEGEGATNVPPWRDDTLPPADEPPLPAVVTSGRRSDPSGETEGVTGADAGIGRLLAVDETVAL